MSLNNNSTLFDAQQDLAFQDFSSTTIQSDIPAGRISPNITVSPASRQPNPNLYSTGLNIGNSIEGATKSGGVLSLDYYTGYFDIDTVTVLTRCAKSLLPQEDFIGEVLSGIPDLYGPFWVPTTLIFSLFLTSSLTTSVKAYLAGRSYAYDFTRLGAAVTLIYSYFLGLPFLVWGALKYWAGTDERGPIEIVSVYGYSATIWIIVSWLTLIPYSLFQLAIVFAATAVSLFFIIRNIYPIISVTENSSAKLLIIVIGLLHLALGLALYWGFMAGGGGAMQTPEVIPPN